MKGIMGTHEPDGMMLTRVMLPVASSPPVHTTNHVHWRLQMFLSFVHYLPLPTDAIHNVMKSLEGQATFGRTEGGGVPCWALRHYLCTRA